MILEKLYNAVINTASAGDNTVASVPAGAPSNTYLAIDFVMVFPTLAVSVTFKSGTNSISGPIPLAAQQALIIENSLGHQDGVMTCNPGEAFIVNLGGAVQVGGFARYRIVGY